MPDRQTAAGHFDTTDIERNVPRNWNRDRLTFTGATYHRPVDDIQIEGFGQLGIRQDGDRRARVEHEVHGGRAVHAEWNNNLVPDVVERDLYDLAALWKLHGRRPGAETELFRTRGRCQG